MRLNWQKVLIYFVVPLGTSLALIAMYFSGIRFFETLVAAPYMDSIHVNSRREFGLLENLQNLLLLAILVAFYHVKRQEKLLLSVLMAGLVCLTIVVFLEEIDYGLHFYELARGIPPDEAREVSQRNLHNVGDRTSQLKRISEITMVLVFVVAPFALMRTQNPTLRYLRPDPYSVLTLVAALIVRSVAHALEDRGLGVGLEGNISEFRELVTYYLFALYAYQLASGRSLGSPKQSAHSPVQE